ncbi:odorant receptor 13a-like [Pogonomyrmex barbatus]|uniref:Odorant receptor 13a-like n=1 Tax=Pogonomyrmex barbatus TaxID=144034 RepID=A0A8N1S340_9HYME|nr:odorant receptor 13a-like [Pogonomyrmex barbatus]
MAKDWKDCAKSDIEMRQAVNKAKISDRVANTVVIYQTVAVTLYGIGIVFGDVDVTQSNLPHIVKMEFPFQITTQRMYRSIVTIELIYIIMTGWCSALVNVLILTLSLHVGGQIDIVCCWLAKLMPKPNMKENEFVAATISKIIQKHQKIIYFSQQIENMYSFIALILFLGNTIMICFLAFLFVTALDQPDTTDKIFRSLPFYGVTNIEAFIFVVRGCSLFSPLQSKALELAAYNSAWYDLEPKFGRMLLFVILRSQKRMTLTVGKMIDLSLQCYARIMNSSGSYLTMLLAMQ